MSGLTNKDEEGVISDEKLLQESILKPWLFAELVNRYQASFLRKAQSILRDPRDAEEIVLDAFTKIYFNAASFVPQSGAQFSSWAYRILLNTAFTRYQKLIKEGQRFSEIDPEFEQFISTEEKTVINETEDGIERILARLPGHFAQVLRLHYLERWSHQDIAELNKENIGTIKARIHRAKEAFRREGKGEEVDVLL
ncbi:MAG TPA: RNA polymerase sigma factor [Candidatus Paceibacterota bacterium]|nr:RNA polymerase sigma factor [Candidatus Paceibacterota bacterium]HMO82793.1 RNA polymerase sigma factor [Candidatus Paceibacterota bacterium]